ncbi:ACP phosphodiesterase [Aquimarina sp. W85]|uniref:acyl carrier protein phosphodiesterase n=1 Tax=Aquimarina rhodophyticola TaxID=3342246 RepID=UPI0036703365
MNFLAHIYLSGDDTELKIGNFIADSVKGKKFEQFPKRIQQGITLHRQIDFYTDTHPIVRQSVGRLFPKYSHYSTVIVDILYDHYLAANWNTYHKTSLPLYVASFYQTLQDHYGLLPKRIKDFLPHMIKDNWLASYATIDGISKILYQMNHRTKNRSKMNLAVVELERYYEAFESEFTLFFEELMLFTKNEIEKI